MTATLWDILVPLKRTDQAKSRLRLPPGMVRRDLVEAMALDTVEAVLRGCATAVVHAVTDDTALCERLLNLDSRVQIHRGAPGGLNAALSYAETRLRSRDPDRRRAVVLGDLPALRPDDVTDLLTRASSLPRSVVADRSGVGTTVLTAVGTHPLHPQFGPHSLARHVAGGALLLEAAARMRTDVDRFSDLDAALTLGVGRRTSTALSGAPGTPSPLARRRALSTRP